MKRSYQKLIAILLTAMLVLSLLPTMAFALGDGEGRADEPVEFKSGYIPFYHVGTTAVTDAYLRGEALEINGTNLVQPADTLPSSYNSNTLGYVTSVKNQNPYGSCWAHAAMASIESYMIKHGVHVGSGSAATTSLNLSETQHCFFNYSTAYDAEGMLTGDKCTLTGSDSCLDSGGNGEMSAYTLQRWCGAADESQSALTYSKASTVASSGLGSQYSYNYNVCHVQNSEWIPGSNIAAVKQAIMDYGAGNISYYETGNAYTYICTIDTSSQSSSSHKWANHAITIVGWDDSIATSNFKPNKPSGKGAWICKNSWGTSYFSSGYCYISYEDTSVLEGYIYFYDAEPIDNYAHNYQYDGSCNVVTFGKGWNNSISTCTGFANNTKVANVFTAKGSELLKAVGFCSWDEGMSYTLEVYKNPTTGNPSSGTLMASQTGTITYAGYYTIPLNTPVSLSANDTFSIVFTQNVSVADDNGYYVHTPYDATFNNTNVVSWAKWTHTNHGNTSYYKEPNGSWTDCADNGDFRIKAYTDDYTVSYTVTAVSNNTSYGTVSVNGTVITASPKSGYYVSGCEVTSGTATFTINGNTINVNPSSDCTIKVIFAAKPTYTVNFVACGSSVGSQTAQVNDVITLPASATAVSGYDFIGWTAAQVAETTTKPSYYAPGASYTVTANATLYALYSRSEGSGAVVYQLADSLENGGTYILVADGSVSGTTGYAVGNTAVSSSHYLTPVSVTVSNNVCTPSSSNLAKVLWTASGSSANGFTFYNEAVGKYMGLDSSEYLAPTSSGLAWYYTADRYLDNKVDSEGYYYLSYSSSNTTRYTTSKSGAAISLYQAVNSAVTYYNTDPVVQTHTHSMTYTAAVAPTCTEAGHSAYYYCAGCGKYFSDAQGSHEITLASTVIAATGHTAGSAVTENNVAPTCGSAGGYDTVVYCTVCGAELSRTHSTVAATGNHSYGAWVSNNNGTHKHTCSVCGKVETVNCSYNDVVTPPTATEQGYTTHTCTVCAYSYVDSYTAPIGQTTYYTVSFSVPSGVSAVASQTAEAGSSITLPSAGAPAGYAFLGWVTAAVDNSASRPASILTGSYTVNADVTLKALYSYSQGSGSATVYQKVESAPADWAGNYVITYGTSASSMYVLKGLSGNTRYESTSAGGAALLSNAGITYSDGVLSGAGSAYIFKVASASGKYSIRNASTGTYLGSYSNYLYSRSSYSSTNCLWSLSVSSGNVTASNSYSSRYPYLTFKTSSSYFMINSSTSNGLSFWKETVGGGSVTYYTTEIGGSTPDPEPTYYTVSFSVPGGVSAVASQTVEAGSVISLPSAGAPAGYTFLGWVTADVNNASALPSNVLTGSYTVAASITLKALYSYTSQSAGGYELLSAAPSNWAGNYVITYGSGSSMYVLKGLSGNTKYESASAGGAVLLSSAGITNANNSLTGVTSAYVFAVASTGSKYTIRNASTGTYLGSYNSYLYSRSSYSSSYCQWSLSISGSNVTAANSASSRYPYLSFSSSKYFMVASSAPTGLCFWKETAGGSATWYTTVIG